MSNIPVTCNLRVVPDMESAKKLKLTPEQVSQELMTMLSTLELEDKLYPGYRWPGNGAVLQVPELNDAPDFASLVSMIEGWLVGYAAAYEEYYAAPEAPFMLQSGSPNDVKLLLYYYSDVEERWCSYGFEILDKKKVPWRMESGKFKGFYAAVEVGVRYPMK